ncbi:nitrilase and fragile histidine triad fusion protein NitFhit [Teleopsis dalmanni]|uniref:nitrilase and fragile histidine triad fusion protein NitFhit n=1 Tax=Teleopsis dalmanni TaxID=139649 RepID=UPI0018CD4B21|nr:nitrilase and fragile histidine triad fusion protein NitFhit [Teleopsis dalmanni]
MLRVLNVVVRKVGNNTRQNLNKFHSGVVSRMSAATSEGATGKSIIAISQMRTTNNKEENFAEVQKLVEEAKSQQASFLFLPECCDFVGENRKETIELSEPLTGATMKQYQKLAKQHKIWLSLGGIHESILDDNSCKTDKIYNAHVIVNDLGEVVTVYRKLHLFDVDTPEFRFRESDVVTAGPRLVSPIATPIGYLGLQICYDLRFAETSVLLRKSGAQILTYPSAFAFTTGKAHWETLLRSRAIENQCFVIAPAQIGYHNQKRRSWGHAMVIDPWGKILTDMGGECESAVATVEIDLSSILPIRKSMPCFDHRRGDIYCLTAYGTATFEPTEDRNFANNKILKETIFYESEHCYAFTNLTCVVEGHVLVSTKRVTPRLSGLNCHEMAELFEAVCKIQRMLEKIYKTTSATVTVQDGTDAGQTVPHVHFHVMPRRPGDFGHNDQIYVKLEDRVENQRERTIEERISEAQIYREFLKAENTNYDNKIV